MVSDDTDPTIQPSPAADTRQTLICIFRLPHLQKCETTGVSMNNRRSGKHTLSTDTAVRLLAIQPVGRQVRKRRGYPVARESEKAGRATRVWLILAGPLAYGLQRLAANWPETLETVYARGFYPVVMGAWSRFTGLFPFSVMEALLLLLVALTPAALFMWVRHIRSAPAGLRGRRFVRPIANLLIVASVWYALSIPMWNLHYGRQAFAVLAGLETAPATVEELKGAALWLTDKVNTARGQVLEDESGVMRLRDDIRTTFSRTSSGYDVLSERFPFLEGRYGPPKAVLLSRVMSHTRIIGLYTVTTAEANVDVDMPDGEIPFTALHELAHQRGIAPEDEANAVAWFASRVHPDPDHRYSGALQAWIHTTNALHAVDRKAWEEVRSALSPAVERDLAAQSAYWSQFDSVVDKVAEKANDVWLKSNGQADGVRSYGRMVDLVLAEYRRNQT